MCVVSMVGDEYSRRKNWPSWPESIPFPEKYVPQNSVISVSRAEFEALKKQVELMRKELEAAKAQDIAEGNPDCEMEDKVIILRKIAELVGVRLDDIFKEPV